MTKVGENLSVGGLLEKLEALEPGSKVVFDARDLAKMLREAFVAGMTSQEPATDPENIGVVG